MERRSCFITGGSGLVGRAVIAHLLADSRVDRVYALTRAGFSSPSCRLIAVEGNLHAEGLGIAGGARDLLAGEIDIVIHAGATTSFSQSIEDARLTNCAGTTHLLGLTADWHGVNRWVHVSTAFVAGLSTGRVAENRVSTPAAWANAYEQSKHEAEATVRAARSDWAIARPATIVCDDVTGRITQANAVHRALRLYFGGLAAMLPGSDASTLDVVTTDYCARGIAGVALAADAPRQTYHFCAGEGAMPLDTLLEASYNAFLRAPAWRRKGIARPVRTDIETYRLFETAVEDAGSDRVRQAVRSLSHFVPQLAYPKIFDTRNADALLGEPAPAVASFWTAMVDNLVGTPATQAAA